MFIGVVEGVTDELVAAFERLVPQLTDSHPPPGRQALVDLVASESSRLLIARYPDETGSIVGALCLVIYRVPTGPRATVEDVIVDDDARGRGIGEALMQRAISIARTAGAASLALTSNPRRAAANRLYQRLGFSKRDTNAYILKL